MPDLFDAFRGLLARTLHAPTREAIFCRISAQKVDAFVRDGELDPHNDYLEVRIKRIHLAHGREWFTRYDPVVFAAVEFPYGGATTVAPRVVGPEIIKQLGGQAAKMTTVANTRVVGPQRFGSGGIAITVVLSRIESRDLLLPLLDTLQEASTALDLATGLVPFATVARVVINGITAVTGDDSALIARRDEFRPVIPGYFALVDSDCSLEPSQLFVKDGRLYMEGAQGVKTLDDADYVLYVVDAVGPGDFDIERLPLYQLWRTVATEAAKSSTEAVWESAKANMAALMGMLATSNDLTPTHASHLMDTWESTMVTLHKRAVAQSHLAPAALATPASALDAVRDRALATLRL